jgi:hypothetical protein
LGRGQETGERGQRKLKKKEFLALEKIKHAY